MNALPPIRNAIPGLDLADLEPALDNIRIAAAQTIARTEEPASSLMEAELGAAVPPAPFRPEPGPRSLALQTKAQLERALRTIDFAKVAFEDSLRTALDRLGGKLLFDMKLDSARDNCRRVAAIRLGRDDDKLFALVILPQRGGSIRVESTMDSTNPLAAIAASYDEVLSSLRVAA